MTDADTAPDTDDKPRRNPAEHLAAYRFREGQRTPNPGGRPKGIVKLVREETSNGKDLVERMGRIWRGEEKGFSSRERMEAGKWLADRGFGRSASTEIQLTGELSGNPLVDEITEAAQETAADALLSLAEELGTDPTTAASSDEEADHA